MADIIAYDPVVVDPATAQRADEVKQRLHQIKDSLEDNFIDLCELLKEAQENAYHQVWGYTRFGDWVEQASELDLSARQAYYYVTIIKKANTLGLSRAEIKACKISKLKEIFSLEPAEHGKDMKQLVEAAPSTSLEDIKESVRKVKAVTGAPEMVHMTLKFTTDVKETVDKAFELARRLHGSTVVDGEVVEASNSLCLEYICASFLQDENNFPEGVQPADLVETRI